MQYPCSLLAFSSGQDRLLGTISKPSLVALVPQHGSVTVWCFTFMVVQHEPSFCMFSTVATFIIINDSGTERSTKEAPKVLKGEKLLYCVIIFITSLDLRVLYKPAGTIRLHLVAGQLSYFTITGYYETCFHDPSSPHLLPFTPALILSSQVHQLLPNCRKRICH